ncbi:hypothetical protein [Leptolyngbya sp. PCC 6406]|uniref:hypothetical protein n=1 Tax=Leptolyngbya sp. PCC 6406 TaxID=1173264 RepID=UPI0002ABF0AA|nr:hypothetical protein [Leptolyngbya sp. PCC 6406]
MNLFQMPNQLANQDIALILVYQPVESPDSPAEPLPLPEDPLIGLFSGSPELATQAEIILEQNITPNSGFTWKQS